MAKQERLSGFLNILAGGFGVAAIARIHEHMSAEAALSLLIAAGFYALATDTIKHRFSDVVRTLSGIALVGLFWLMTGEPAPVVEYQAVALRNNQTITPGQPLLAGKAQQLDHIVVVSLERPYPPGIADDLMLAGLSLRNNGEKPVAADTVLLSFSDPIEKWQENTSDWIRAATNDSGWAVTYQSLRTSIEPEHSVPIPVFQGTPASKLPIRVKIRCMYGQKEVAREFTLLPR